MSNNRICYVPGFEGLRDAVVEQFALDYKHAFLGMHITGYGDGEELEALERESNSEWMQALSPLNLKSLKLRIQEETVIEILDVYNQYLRTKDHAITIRAGKSRSSKGYERSLKLVVPPILEDEFGLVIKKQIVALEKELKRIRKERGKIVEED